MLIATPEERTWLEARWRETRRNLMAVLRPHLDAVIAEIAEGGAVSDATWTKTVSAVAAELNRRRAAAGPQRAAMFEVAISMMGEPGPLRTALEKGLGAGAGEGLIWAVCKRGLSSLRHTVTSDSTHRAQTWSRIDRLSRRIHADAAATGHRCHGEHFEAVVERIRIEHPDDRNLPRTVETIEAYFLEFCGDCEQGFDPDDAPGAVEGRPELGWSRLEAADIAALPDAEHMTRALAGCLDGLPEHHRKIVEVAYGLGAVVEMSVSAYCARVGMDRRRFYRDVGEALPMLLACLEGSGIGGLA